MIVQPDAIIAKHHPSTQDVITPIAEEPADNGAASLGVTSQSERNQYTFTPDKGAELKAAGFPNVKP